MAFNLNRAMELGNLTNPRHYIYILCMSAISLQVYHLYDQSYVNPIYTDTQILQKNLQDVEFPVIFKICVQPGFDRKELNSVGKEQRKLCYRNPKPKPNFIYKKIVLLNRRPNFPFFASVSAKPKYRNQPYFGRSLRFYRIMAEFIHSTELWTKF